MNLIMMILSGIIQAITEFIPVSSSGHAALLFQMFGYKGNSSVLYAVLLHISTMMVVICVFPKDVANLLVAFVSMLRDIFANIGIFFANLFSKRKQEYYIVNSGALPRRFVNAIILSNLASAVVAVGIRSAADKVFFNFLFLGIAFIINGLLLIVEGKIKGGTKKIRNLNSFDAVIIGAVRGFAVIPGMSSIGLSAIAGITLGLERSFAIKFALLSSVPTIAGAFIMELMQSGGNTVGVLEISDCLIGMIVSFIAGIICVKIALGIMKNHRFVGFAIYSVLIGVIAIIMDLFM